MVSKAIEPQMRICCILGYSLILRLHYHHSAQRMQAEYDLRVAQNTLAERIGPRIRVFPNSAAGLRACGIDVEDGASCLARTRSGFTWRLTEYAHLLRRGWPELDSKYVLNGRVPLGHQDFESLCDLIHQLKELTVWNE